jgi:hypothetical protein
MGIRAGGIDEGADGVTNFYPAKENLGSVWDPLGHKTAQSLNYLRSLGTVSIPPELSYLYFILSHLLTHATCHDCFFFGSQFVLTIMFHKSFTPGGEPVEEGVQQDRVVACVVGMGDRKGGTGEEG